MTPTSPNGSRDAGHYRIRLSGRLDPRWAAWFDGLTLQREDDGTSVLSGRIPDQAALHGLLQRVRDLGIPLISVVRTDVDGADASPTP